MVYYQKPTSAPVPAYTAGNRLSTSVGLVHTVAAARIQCCQIYLHNIYILAGLTSMAYIHNINTIIAYIDELKVHIHIWHSPSTQKKQKKNILNCNNIFFQYI